MDSECGYCGEIRAELEREHVVAACLYPASRSTSKVQRITIPACPRCNRSWADDEAHFRNIVLMAGESNHASSELWPKAVRSFDQIDGPRRLRDIRRLMEPTEVAGVERWRVYPGRDDRVLRVVRKIIRGLSYFHGLGIVRTDERVWADVMKFRIPDELAVEFRHREPDIFQYWFESYHTGEFRSVWYLKFFERLTFIASVSAEEGVESERA